MNDREKLIARRRALAAAAVTTALAVSSVCAAQETVIHTFKGDSGSDGSFPTGGMVFDANGNLFGTTSAGGVGEFADGTVFTMSPDSSGGFKFQTIHQFSQATGDGGNPGSSVVFDAAGNLYGTTPNGGSGCGIVYELSPTAAAGGAWTETILHKFGSNGSDGCGPSGRLIFDQAGDLYGGTWFGGGGASNLLFCSNGCGTTYKLHLADGKWTESVLHRFTGEGTDGVNPSGSLAFDAAGNLWGATAFGGAGDSSTCGDPNGGAGIFFCGMVFELSPNADGSWTESTRYNFKDASTGWNPFSGLIADQAGNLVGTTENGGSALDGTVFQIIPEGNGKVEERLIHEFVGEADGSFPQSGLTLGAAGTLYGTAYVGGGTAFTCTKDSGGGCGIVYKLTPNSTGSAWTETILYTFLGGSDGAVPSDDRLALDASGDVFGLASSGGDFDFSKTGCPGNLPGGCGVAFKVQQ
jgi:uncharacterized repeat protein (TIGR03803 family)